MTRRQRVPVFVAVMFCSMVGHATNTVEQLPDVTIVGSKPALVTLPAAGDYFDVDEIRLHSYDNVHQVLRKTAGVYVQEENGYGLLPNVSLRGVDTHRSQKITMMEDGVLTAPAPYSAPSAYYAPTMGRMSGLEVLKGSSQIRYGPHTTGGALNYLSTPVPSDGAGFLKTLYGSYNEFRLHTYYGGMKPTETGRVGGLAEVYHRRTDGFKTIRGVSGADTGFYKTDYTGKLAWELDKAGDQRIELKVGYTDFDADETYLGLSESDFSDDPYQRYMASQFDNFSGEHIRSYLRHSMDVGDSLRLTSTAYYNDFHRNWYKLQDVKDVDGLPAGSIGMSEALAAGGPALATLRGENPGIWRRRANNRDYVLWGVQCTASAEGNAADADHLLTVGVRYHVDEAKQFQWQDELTVDGSGNVVAVSPGVRGAAGNRVQEARAVAAFVQDEANWERFSLIPGIRAEHIEGKVLDKNGSSGKQTGDNDVLAAGLGARYRLADEWILFGGLYRGYSVPSPSDAITKDLDEETSVSAELGTRYRSRGLGLELSCFHTALSDLIVGGYVGTDTDTDSENAGDIEVLGVEAKAEYNPGLRQDWGFKTPIWCALTFTDAALDSDTVSKDPSSLFSGGRDGNAVPYIPDFQVSAGCGVVLDKLEGEIAATYVDSTFSTANNSSAHVNPVTGKPDARFGKIDSRVVVNASVRYAVRDDMWLFANVLNLFDEAYLASRHPHGPRPGQPFTASGGIEVRF